MKTETHNIEFKRTWKDEYLEWICGYANAKKYGRRWETGKRWI